MFNRKILKDRAKAVLSRSFATSLLACFIVSLAGSGIIGISTKRLQGIEFTGMTNLRIAAIFAVAGILIVAGLAFFVFVTAPLSVGLKHFMLKSADGNTSLENLMYPFKSNYKNIVLTQFVKNLYIILWSIPGFIPVMVAFWKFGLAEKITEIIAVINGDSLIPAFKLLSMMSFLSILTAIFSIPAIIKDLQYFMTEYLLADNPNMPCRKAIAKSKEMMVGNKWALVKLIFSFAGWYIAANLFCCLGSIILRPYIEATYAQLYLEISGQNIGCDDNFGPRGGNPFDFFGRN